MSSSVYIANYPSHLTTEDLQNLFQDFVGASIVKSVKKNNKCFSFLSCVDEKQIQDIVESMNGIDVCGRSLVVRSTNKDDGKNSRNRTFKQKEDLKISHQSSDSNRQFRKENSPNTKSSLMLHSVRPEDNSWGNSDVARSHPPKNPQLGTLPKGNLDSKCYYSSASASKTPYLKFVNADSSLLSKEADSNYHSSPDANKTPYSKFINAVKATSPLQCKDSGILQEANSKYNSKNTANNVNNTLYSKFVNAVKATSPLQSKDSENFSKTNPNNYHSSPEAFNANSSAYSEVPARQNISNGGNTVPCNNHRSKLLREEISHLSAYSNSSRPNTDANNDVFNDLTTSNQLFYVSVHNFPLYTGCDDLLQLFADHNPVRVHMVCNLPRMDHKPTEAIIAFFQEDDAFNAVFSFDNAVYNGRILLVTEATDVF